MTAAHQLPRHLGRAPWGTRHVRIEGTAATACGLQTTGWHVFWELPFDRWSKDACPACAEAYAAHLMTTPGRRGGSDV